MDDYEGGGTPEEGGSHQGPPGGEGAGIALVDALSEAMYDLAHTGAKRVAGLCTSPTELACWALELLEEQACTVGTFHLYCMNQLQFHTGKYAWRGYLSGLVLHTLLTEVKTSQNKACKLLMWSIKEHAWTRGTSWAFWGGHVTQTLFFCPRRWWLWAPLHLGLRYDSVLQEMLCWA